MNGIWRDVQHLTVWADTVAKLKFFQMTPEFSPIKERWEILVGGQLNPGSDADGPRHCICRANDRSMLAEVCYSALPQKFHKIVDGSPIPAPDSGLRGHRWCKKGTVQPKLRCLVSREVTRRL
jgi:hypothetical protein